MVDTRRIRNSEFSLKNKLHARYPILLSLELIIRTLEIYFR